MKLAFYQGRSFISRLIRFVTWGKYSHAAVILDDGRILEAWHKNGVRWISHLGDGHSPGTLIDVFTIPPLIAPLASVMAAEGMIGAKYDFWGILGFAFRRRWQARGKWFCSEAAAWICGVGGVALVRGVPAYRISPSHLASSALLTAYGRAITGKTRTVIHKYPDDHFSPVATENPATSITARTAEPSPAPLATGGLSSAGMRSKCHGGKLYLGPAGDWVCHECGLPCERIFPPRPPDIAGAETVVDLKKADQ